VAIYRPRSRRWPLVGAIGLIGLAIGFGLGWGLKGDEQPDPVDALALLHSTLASAAGTLEVVDVEYRESVQDGEVVSSPEYEGARDALERSRQRYVEVRAALGELDPELVTRANDLYADIARLVDGRAPADEVMEVTGELSALLRDAVGGGS
jgi:hypothetical protein